MADHTAIEWTDATWNPITGCAIVSPGCTNCYAMRLAGTRLAHHPSRAGLTRETKAGPVWTGEVRLNRDWLDQPLRWRRPRRIFVCAHGDLFAEGVPDEWLDQVFAVMALAPQHTFQVLTKRPARMRAYIERTLKEASWLLWTHPTLGHPIFDYAAQWSVMFRHVWLGVSAEDQRRADERIPDLLATPAGVRFVSAEPLLGPLEIGWAISPVRIEIAAGFQMRGRFSPGLETLRPLDWIIVGGESGQGARPMHQDWARQIRDACAEAGTAFFFKQWGNYLPRGQMMADGKPWAPAGGNRLHATKSLAGRFLDGAEHNAMPEALR